MDENIKWLVEGLGSALMATLAYLLHHFVSELKKQIAELKDENQRQGEVLVRLEHDLNEAWFHVRALIGVGGGRRHCRVSTPWRKSHVSRHWKTGTQKAFAESGHEEEDL